MKGRHLDGDHMKDRLLGSRQVKDRQLEHHQTKAQQWPGGQMVLQATSAPLSGVLQQNRGQ